MNEQKARELMMETLYGEISETDKQKLTQYMQAHPELQQELEELQDVRAVLQQTPEVEIRDQLLPVAPQRRSFSEWRNQAVGLMPRSKWAKTLVAAAACLVLTFIGFSAANLNIHSTQKGFSFHLGYGNQIHQAQPIASQSRPHQVKHKTSRNHPQSQPQPQQVVFTKKQVQNIVQKMQKNNAQILEQYAKALTKNNRQKLQQVVNYFKQRRSNNVQLFQTALDHYQTALDHYQTALNQYQQKTNYRLLKTHQVMGQMAQVIVARNQQ